MPYSDEDESNNSKRRRLCNQDESPSLQGRAQPHQAPSFQSLFQHGQGAGTGVGVGGNNSFSAGGGQFGGLWRNHGNLSNPQMLPPHSFPSASARGVASGMGGEIGGLMGGGGLSNSAAAQLHHLHQQHNQQQYYPLSGTLSQIQSLMGMPGLLQLLNSGGGHSNPAAGAGGAASATAGAAAAVSSSTNSALLAALALTNNNTGTGNGGAAAGGGASRNATMGTQQHQHHLQGYPMSPEAMLLGMTTSSAPVGSTAGAADEYIRRFLMNASSNSNSGAATSFGFPAASSGTGIPRDQLLQMVASGLVSVDSSTNNNHAQVSSSAAPRGFLGVLGSTLYSQLANSLVGGGVGDGSGGNLGGGPGATGGTPTPAATAASVSRNVDPPAAVASFKHDDQDEKPAAAKAPSGPRPGLTGRAPVTLYMSCDDERLSAYHALARKHIEFFEAGQEDISTNARGRNRPIVLGQVGIRCRHCAHLAPRRRQRAAMYYPFKLDLLYQACQTLTNVHLCEQCQNFPSDVRAKLVKLRGEKTTALVGKKYWADGARIHDVYESEDGMRFKPKEPKDGTDSDGEREGEEKGANEKEEEEEDENKEENEQQNQGERHANEETTALEAHAEKD